MSQGLLAVTSVMRGAGAHETSGYLRVVDLDDGRVLATYPTAESERRAGEANPRGGLRGARGIGSTAEHLVFANTECLFVFDARWRLMRRITHPWMGGIHDILVEPEGIWVTCTNADLLVRVDWDGRLIDQWSWRDDPRDVRALGFRRVGRVRRDVDYRDPRRRPEVANVSHLNAVARGADGELVVSLGRVLPAGLVRRQRAKGTLRALAGPLLPPKAPGQVIPFPAGKIPGSSYVIVAVEARPGTRFSDGASLHRIARVPDTAVPNHNLLVDDDRMVYNDSNTGEVVVRGVERETCRIAVPGAPAFARGLVRLDEDRVLVGSQAPAAVHLVELDAHRVARSVVVGEPEHESVYAICRLPDAFLPPPPELRWREGPLDVEPAGAEAVPPGVT